MCSRLFIRQKQDEDVNDEPNVEEPSVIETEQVDAQQTDATVRITKYLIYTV